jgi:hypothetical protein
MGRVNYSRVESLQVSTEILRKKRTMGQYCHFKQKKQYLSYDEFESLKGSARRRFNVWIEKDVCNDEGVYSGGEECIILDNYKRRSAIPFCGHSKISGAEIRPFYASIRRFSASRRKL